VTVKQALRHGAAVLAGMDDPAREARILLTYVTGWSSAGLLAGPERMVDPVAYQALLDRRAAHEPVALILGVAEFWSLPFAVSRDTLLPRPDSETVVQAALDACPLSGQFDLVLANPPYIRRGDLPGLAPDVRYYEPARALDGGVDGLDAYRTIAAALPDLLAPGGVAVLEVGYDQADAVAALMAGRTRFATDLAGIRRAVLLDLSAGARGSM